MYCSPPPRVFTPHKDVEGRVTLNVSLPKEYCECYHSRLFSLKLIGDLRSDPSIPLYSVVTKRGAPANLSAWFGDTLSLRI
ncbi:hypothetical protein NPIL_546131 [Nephila pilipes]|uniref:Uncharacterized protein n=1 Tax=Nephila pilipes TaxID=299642 RepID=A0A8X6N727_NEPPI|nr:hypothetical protein NPIL_546131 [Nephila pilipes]